MPNDHDLVWCICSICAGHSIYGTLVTGRTRRQHLDNDDERNGRPRGYSRGLHQSTSPAHLRKRVLPQFTPLLLPGVKYEDMDDDLTPDSHQHYGLADDSSNSSPFRTADASNPGEY